MLPLLFAFLNPPFTPSVCLEPHPSVAREFYRSWAVVLGIPTSVRTVPDSGESYGGDVYTVAVREALRGSPLDTIELFSENTSARFPMDIGSSYVLFVQGNPTQRWVNNCGNSGLVSERKTEIKALRGLKAAVMSTPRPGRRLTSA